MQRLVRINRPFLSIKANYLLINDKQFDKISLKTTEEV